MTGLTPRFELSRSVLGALPSSGAAFECSDGSTVPFRQGKDAGCADADLTACGATAGDPRACARALLADACGATRELPAACAPLWTEGCSQAGAFLPIDPSCRNDRELHPNVVCAGEREDTLLGTGVSSSVVDPGCASSIIDMAAIRSADGSLRLERRTADWRQGEAACGFYSGERLPELPCSAPESYEAHWLSAL